MNDAPHPFTLRQLQYLVAVAEELSFRAASERCNVSQPSLSSQIAQLESALGVQLFERNSKRVLVTAVGTELISRVKRLLVDADEVVTLAGRISDPLAGTLRLGIIPTISPYLLPALTPQLRTALPRLRLVWLEEKTSVLMSKLAGGQLDGAIVALEAELGEVVQEVIATDPFMLLTRTEHPLAAKTSPVSQAELKGEELLLLDDGHCFRQQALDACSGARARESEFRATSLSTLVQMVAGGAGITLIPALAVEAEAKRARLFARPFNSPAAHRTIALVWRKGSSSQPVLRAIAERLRQVYPLSSMAPKRAGHSAAGKRR